MEVRLMEQRTLGADHPSLPPHSAQARRFTTLRTTAATCADLRSQAARLFRA